MNKESKYFEGIGRRKEATARVRLYTDSYDTKGGFTVNGASLLEYFKVTRLRECAEAPLKVLGALTKKLNVEAKVRGGGIKGQAEALSLGLARALVNWRPDLRSEMRSRGYLTRDARVVERKKYGLRKARRAQQWRKR